MGFLLRRSGYFLYAMAFGLLDRLVGCTVTEVRLTLPGADLKVDFDDSFSLVIFADQANQVDEYCNYTLSTKNMTIVNGPRSKVIVSGRELQQR